MWWFILPLAVLVAAIIIWVASRDELSQEGQRDQEWLTRFYEEEPTYTAQLIARYGFMSIDKGKILDRTYDYLPLDKKVIQLKPEVFKNEEKLEQALKRARNNVKVKAFKYRQRIKKLEMERLDNLKTLSIGELDELGHMAEALSGATRPKVSVVRKH